jgi:hypothetical protein
MSLATFFTLLIIILYLSAIWMAFYITVFGLNCSSQKEKEPHDECAHDYSKWENDGDPKTFRLDPPFYGEWGRSQKRKRVCSKCNHIDFMWLRID